jgi:Resolvase, N terminal domain
MLWCRHGSFRRNRVGAILVACPTLAYRVVPEPKSAPCPTTSTSFRVRGQASDDHFEREFYVRKLAKNGIKLVSITQEIGDDPMHVMMRRMMALFDDYQSKENGKHTLRAMKENARQGFWNGSRPPIGYRIVAAEQRGAKVPQRPPSRVKMRRRRDLRVAGAEVRLDSVGGGLVDQWRHLGRHDFAIRRKPMRSGRPPPSKTSGNRPSRRPWCGGSLRPPASGYASPAAATVVTIFAHSPNASRSQTPRSASWDRRAIY